MTQLHHRRIDPAASHARETPSALASSAGRLGLPGLNALHAGLDDTAFQHRRVRIRQGDRPLRVSEAPGGTLARSARECLVNSGAFGAATLGLNWMTGQRQPHRVVPFAAVLGAAMLAAALISSLREAGAVLYVAVVLCAARSPSSRWMAASGITCAVLTGLTLVATHERDPFEGASASLAVTLVAIAVTSLVTMVNNSDKNGMDQQAHMLELGHDTIIVCDDADRIVHWSDAAECLYGWRREQALGACCQQLLQTEFPEDGVTQDLCRDGRWSGKLIRYRQDGARILLASNWFLRLDARGRHEGMVEASSDITAEHEAREAAAQLEHRCAAMADELAHAARISTLGQLAASIVHEVNQPLAAIMTNGWSAKRWMSRPTPDVAEVATCLDRIVANATRAGEVVTRIRALASKKPPEIQRLDMSVALNDAIDLVGGPLGEGAIAVRTAIEPGLAPASADPVQVQQVLVNLLLNAIQALQNSTNRPREIRINASRASASMIRIDVSDNGSGIASEDPDRIFEPFFTSKRDGMGMGLAICRTIIEAQAGAIWASNNIGHGATITMLLPEARAICGGSDLPRINDSGAHAASQQLADNARLFQSAAS